MHRDLFLRHLMTQFSDLDPQQMDNLISRNLISDHQVSLPQSVLQQAQNFVELIWKISRQESYQNKVRQMYPEVHWAKNDSLFMSYDFHLDSNGQLKLIEVNTNASFMVLGSYLYDSQNLSLPLLESGIDRLKGDLLNELKLVGFDSGRLPFYIIDEKPSEQKLYSEFLVTAELFRSWGFQTKIIDTSEVPPEHCFVYNRSIDFLFDQESSKNLRLGYQSDQMCVSPNPKEYVLLADKQRMIEWGLPGFLESLSVSEQDINGIRKFLPSSRLTKNSDPEILWGDRKKLFFKPLRSYGSKQVYSGAKITRKVFEDLLNQEFIAQEYVPPAMVSEDIPFKYDLRFYAYQGSVRMVMARLYRGQTTNLQTEGGGFATVLFS